MTKTVARLYQTFQPEHYTLTVHPDKQTLTFSGQVIIQGKKTGRPSKRITLHQNGLKITEASIVRHDKKDDKSFAVTRINNQKSSHEVRLHADDLLYPGAYTITVAFQGTITTDMIGLYPCFFTRDGVEDFLLATQFESHHAREVFPCIDEPEAKATFDLTVSHEKNLVALGNNPVKATSESALRPGFIETTFETSPKMSTYLLAFVIGDMHSVSGKTKSGVNVNIWSPVTQPKEALNFALDVGIRTIEFFEDYFQTPYPLPKIDHVGLPDFAVGAMENWGLVTYREACLYLYPDAISQSTKEMVALVIAHETSHQWFGNLVTMKWWDDLWLNESFANMMEYEVIGALFPEWHIWDSFVTNEGLQAYRRDATPGVQAVKTEVNHPDEISTVFDPSIVYAKGGRLLYMLKNYLGENDWRTGLTEYFKVHQFSNTRGSDLWDALSKASGKDVGNFMNPWLERSGYPVISVDQHGSHIKISQEHFLDNRDKADKTRIWPTPLFASSADIEHILDTTSLEQTLPNDEFIQINQEAKGHYMVRYASEAHKAALQHGVTDKTLSTIDRLTLLSNSSMLARAGYEPFADTLKFLQAYSNETEEPVWDSISLVLADARRFVDVDENLEQPIKALASRLVATEYKRLGWEEQPTDTAADQKLRATVVGLSAYAEDAETIAKAMELFDAYKDDASIVSAELRGIVFVVAVKQQHPNAIDYLLKLYTDTNNSDLQRDIAGALTATKSPTQAIELLDFAKNPKNVKPQDADRWLFFLLRNRYCRSVAWQWMEENWDSWIIHTYAKDKTYDMFPRYAASVCSTPAQLARFQAFFEPKKDQPALSRNIEIGVEEITNRVAWLKRDLAAVQAFFKAQ
jgi:aminopeptidase N